MVGEEGWQEGDYAWPRRGRWDRGQGWERRALGIEGCDELPMKEGEIFCYDLMIATREYGTMQVDTDYGLHGAHVRIVFPSRSELETLDRTCLDRDQRSVLSCLRRTTAAESPLGSAMALERRRFTISQQLSCPPFRHFTTSSAARGFCHIVGTATWVVKWLSTV